MSWEYRVGRRDTGAETHYAVYEVYYDDNEITCWTAAPVYAFGDSALEVQADLAKMLEATKKPVIDINTLEEVL